MHELIERMLAVAPVLTDGAVGTQLQRPGTGGRGCPDACNLSDPDRVEQVARAYVEAGSRIIMTNTLGANRFMLGRYGLAEEVAAINRAGAEICRKAAEGRAHVFGSVGSSGLMLMTAELSPQQLQEAFAEQVQAMAEGGVDGIVVETMSDPAEARLAVAAARQTGLPVVGCMVFDSGKDNDRTMMGTTPEEAAATLVDAGVDVVGANCGQGVAGFVGICRRLRAATDRPIWIKANAGLPRLVDGKTIFAETPEQFAARVPELAEAGAAFIGGCCGTTPAFIRAIREKLQR